MSHNGSEQERNNFTGTDSYERILPGEIYHDACQAPPSLDRLRFEADWQPSEALPGADKPESADEGDPAVIVRQWVRDAMEELPGKSAMHIESRTRRETFLAHIQSQIKTFQHKAAAAIHWIRTHPRHDLCAGLALIVLVLVIALAAVCRKNAGKTEETNDTTGAEPAVAENAETVNVHPGSGTVIYNRYAALSVSLTVENVTDRDVYVMTWAEGVTAQELYVPAGTSAIFSAPMGTYHVYVATGDSWLNENSLFGSGTLYYTRNDTLFCAYASDVTLSIPADFNGFTQYMNGWIIGR